MKRKIIPRADDGRFENGLDGMDEFAEKVARELCEKYPNVDYFDLKYAFEASFGFAFVMEMAK